MTQDTEKDNVPKIPAKTLNLGMNSVIDLAGLPDDKAAELKRQHAAGLVNLDIKPNEAKTNPGVLGSALGTFNDEVSKATQLDRELEDTFPASDPPTITQPGVKPGAPARERS